MISKLSDKFVNWVFKQSSTTDDEKSLYQYGFFILFSQIIYLIITTVIGIILGIIIESIIFYFSFLFIRRYAGGYHAATEIRCEISTAFSIIISLGIIKLSALYDIRTAIIIFTFISSMSIFFVCPLDSQEKPLNENEFKYFRKVSWIILFVILSIVIISYIFNFNILFYPCSVSLILESILLILGKIKKLHQTEGG